MNYYRFISLVMFICYLKKLLYLFIGWNAIIRDIYMIIVKSVRNIIFIIKFGTIYNYFNSFFTIDIKNIWIRPPTSRNLPFLYPSKWFCSINRFSPIIYMSNPLPCFHLPFCHTMNLFNDISKIVWIIIEFSDIYFKMMV